MSKFIITTLLIFSVTFCISCSQHPRLEPEGPYWKDADNQDIPEPEYRDPNLIWSSIDRTSFDQIYEGFDMARNWRKLIGNPQQAQNINSFDEVPNCSWFTNRIGLVPMTPEQLASGAMITSGPDTTGMWTVFRPKVQGATSGFWIEDIQGNQYIIKFDPPGYPDLATAAAAMGSRYFHACGYNVPQETIVHFRPDMLIVKAGVKFTDWSGEKREFTQSDLDQILEDVHYSEDGRIRSLASLSLGVFGKIKGPYSYDGRRVDDPNDWFDHNNRRELRGLYVIASLINHYDAKDQNSLDVYVAEDGNKFLKHFLIDFGSTFGSDGNGAKAPIKGYANLSDLRDAFVSMLTLGLKTWSYEYAQDYTYPSVGYFESELFHPAKFDAIYPNPAFENMTERDAYWGAKIVMAFSEDHIKALAKTGQYANSEAEAYLVKTLIERRDKIGRHWFSKVNPLDYFEILNQKNQLNISFEDLAVKYNLEPNNAQYVYNVEYKNKTILGDRKFTGNLISLSSDDLNRLKAQFDLNKSYDQQEDYLFKFDIKTKRAKSGWSKPSRLWLWYQQDQDAFTLVGVEHLD